MVATFGTGFGSGGCIEMDEVGSGSSGEGWGKSDSRMGTVGAVATFGTWDSDGSGSGLGSWVGMVETFGTVAH